MCIFLFGLFPEAESVPKAKDCDKCCNADTAAKRINEDIRDFRAASRCKDLMHFVDCSVAEAYNKGADGCDDVREFARIEAFEEVGE